MRKNIRVTVDAGALTTQWTDEEVGDHPIAGYTVVSTIADAKAYILEVAMPERDAWADVVRGGRTLTKFDVIGDEA